jgi:hypothetical protein
MRCLVFRSTAEAPTGVLRPEALTGARGQKASDPQASPATHPFHRRSPRSLPRHRRALNDALDVGRMSQEPQPALCNHFEFGSRRTHHVAKRAD